MATTHYVSNKELLAAMIDYRTQVKEAKKAKRQAPELSPFIGVCFLKIAEHLSRKPNFMSYTFREDMIADAVENCVQYAKNFNPAKSKNPFAYFTQITYFAFLRRITKEKRQLYVKYKATQQLGLLQQSEMHDLEGLGHDRGRSFQVYENITDFIDAFEKGRKSKRRRKPKVIASSGTLKFIGD
jgi:hypothetical protein